ncbi:MAG: phage tail assembly protein [Beduini sp.]|uniref:phage tail assembly protein n=1 Tax=Beduini sp. TaxID=1922300 RepID=UPI00399F4A12
MPYKTQYEFDLPKGYVDQNGELHRHGIMRLATAKDELDAMRDPKVRLNPAYTSIITLSKVIVQLGTLDYVSTEIIENLFVSDLNFLQNLYTTINQNEDLVIQVTCPHCGKTFTEHIVFTDN